MGSTATYFCTPFGLAISFLGFCPNETLLCGSKDVCAELREVIPRAKHGNRKCPSILVHSHTVKLYALKTCGRSIYRYFSQRSLQHRTGREKQQLWYRCVSTSSSIVTKAPLWEMLMTGEAGEEGKPLYLLFNLAVNLKLLSKIMSRLQKWGGALYQVIWRCLGGSVG